MQIKVDRTGTDPTTATITIRDGDGGEERVVDAKDEANAIAMCDALENHPSGSLLGVWRGR
jgi:hypothetical protein